MKRNIPQNIRAAIKAPYNQKEWSDLCSLYAHRCVSCGLPETDVGKLVPGLIRDPTIPTTAICWLRIQPVCKRCSRFTKHRDLRSGGWGSVLGCLKNRAFNKLSSNTVGMLADVQNLCFALEDAYAQETPPFIFE